MGSLVTTLGEKELQLEWITHNVCLAFGLSDGRAKIQAQFHQARSTTDQDSAASTVFQNDMNC